jgi:hypothetical protein
VGLKPSPGHSLGRGGSFEESAHGSATPRTIRSGRDGRDRPDVVERYRDHVGSRGPASPSYLAEVVPSLQLLRCVVIAHRVAGRTRGLPDNVVDLLVRVRAAELEAVGRQRRVAWRTTRDLLGGVVAAGYPLRLVAECLGVGPDSIRTRASRDAWIAAPTAIDVLHIEAVTLFAWRADGLLPNERRLEDGMVYYPAVDLVRAAVAAHFGDRGRR